MEDKILLGGDVRNLKSKIRWAQPSTILDKSLKLLKAFKSLKISTNCTSFLILNFIFCQPDLT